MSLSRRNFLQSLTAAFAGTAALVVGSKAASAEPLIKVVQPNQINHTWNTAKPIPPSIDQSLDWLWQVKNEACRILTGELRSLKIISSGPYQHGAYGQRMGNTVCLREPTRFDYFSDVDWTNMASLIRENMRPVLIDNQSHVGMVLHDDIHRSLSIEDFSKRHIQPAMIAMADHIFRRSRGAELIVTMPLDLPDGGQSANASSPTMNLRSSIYPDMNPGSESFGAQIMRFDVAFGKLMPEGGR